MTRTAIEATLRTRLQSFASELTDLITRAALEAVERGLAHPDSPDAGALVANIRRDLAGGSARRAPAAASPWRRSSPPLDLDTYERMAIQRALSENGGNVLAAAKVLDMSKSAIYRRMGVLGIEEDQRGVIAHADPVAASGEPVSITGYERAAIARAIDESGGDKIDAARRLGIGKSTLYRLAKKHALS